MLGTANNLLHMLFNSLLFGRFFLVVWILYYLTARVAVQVSLLILASFLFYAADKPWLVLLLLTSVLVNALFSLAIARSGSRGTLAIGIGLNLLGLIVFKYGPLFMPPDVAKIPLPIGISFFTFEGVMILVDSWRRRDQARGLAQIPRVALLMSFFPHLVAGPIVKARDFFPQIRPKRISDIDWELAFRSLVTGYFLKMVVADNLREQTHFLDNPSFQGAATSKLLVLLFGYSAQIFADFAGYSLIAIGLAALLGYRLPQNFNYPYIALSFSDFWRRWHITLSTFLRDFLYIPLGGNRHGPARTYFNILLVMGLGGLWHGAAWSYAIWGLMHGLALVCERMISFTLDGPAWRGLRRLGVFLYVSLAWLLFKMPNFQHVLDYLQAVTHNLHEFPDWRCNLAVAVCAMPVVVYHLIGLFYNERMERYAFLAYGLMLFLILTNSGPAGDFIYFQF